MYLDEQKYFIGAVLDISRKAAAVKGRGNINSALSQRRAIAASLKNSSILHPFSVLST